MHYRLPILLIAAFGFFENTFADDATVDFGRDVYGILRKACFECHGAEKQEGDLRLDRRADVLVAESIGVGTPAESDLLRRITLPSRS